MDRHNNALVHGAIREDKANLHGKNNFAERFKILAGYKKKHNFVELSK